MAFDTIKMRTKVKACIGHADIKKHGAFIFLTPACLSIDFTYGKGVMTKILFQGFVNFLQQLGKT